MCYLIVHCGYHVPHQAEDGVQLLNLLLSLLCHLLVLQVELVVLEGLEGLGEALVLGLKLFDLLFLPILQLFEPLFTLVTGLGLGR